MSRGAFVAAIGRDSIPVRVDSDIDEPAGAWKRGCFHAPSLIEIFAGNGAVVAVVRKYGPIVVKYAPGALAFVAKFLQDHPTVPDWTKQRLTDIADRLRKLRPDAVAQISGKLAIIRDEVTTMEDVPADLAGAWLKRAARIEHGANLASRLRRPEQKRALETLRRQSDALLGEVIAAIAYSPESPSDSTTDQAGAVGSTGSA